VAQRRWFFALSRHLACATACLSAAHQHACAARLSSPLLPPSSVGLVLGCALDMELSSLDGRAPLGGFLSLRTRLNSLFYYEEMEKEEGGRKVAARAGTC